jgi:crossover junction endodeoxyribonuclease RuvC
MPERLLSIATELDALVAEYKPSGMAVERVLFSNNARTAMSVGQANGLALVAAARHRVPVVEYSPNEVKLAVCGDGAADKAAVQTMVTRLLGLGEIPRPPDAADALALALTHGWSGRIREQVGESTGSESSLEKAVQRALERDSALNTQKGSVIA